MQISCNIPHTVGGLLSRDHRFRIHLVMHGVVPRQTLILGLLTRRTHFVEPSCFKLFFSLHLSRRVAKEEFEFFFPLVQKLADRDCLLLFLGYNYCPVLKDI